MPTSTHPVGVVDAVAMYMLALHCKKRVKPVAVEQLRARVEPSTEHVTGTHV